MIKSKINFRKGIDIKSDAGYVVSPFSIHPNGNIYEPLIDHEDQNLYLDQLRPIPVKLLNLLKNHENEDVKPADSKNSSIVNEIKFTEGTRNNSLHRVASSIRPYLLSPDAIFKALKEENLFRCIPPLPESELRSIVNSVQNYPIKVESQIPQIGPDAFYGIAGQLANEVSAIDGVSKEAILMQFLICIGNLCGQKFYYFIGGKKIYPSDFLILCGSTGSSKKGTSFSDVKWFFDKYWPEFTHSRLKTGVNSGEGLINCIRDKIISIEKDKTGKEIEVIKDQGALSKIVLFLEPELSRLLKAGKREGSTVTETIRNAWDQVPLEINTSQRSIRSTDYNVSLIAHITPNELKSLVTDIDSSNGFLNRFLFCLAGNAEPKVFPEPFEKVRFSFSTELVTLISFINSIESEVIDLDESARVYYEDIYKEYFYKPESEISDLIGRNIPHLLKMAMLYAILDRSPFIKTEHLKASKALIDFSENSIRYIFKDKIYNKKEKKILYFLSKHSGHSSRGKIQSDCFKNNISKEELDLLSNNLTSKKAIKSELSDGKEIWSLLTESF